MFRIEESDGPIRLLVHIDDDWITSQSTLERQGLQHLYGRFQRTARNVLRDGVGSSELAAIGYRTFVDLFPDEKLRERVRSKLLNNDGCRIEVVAFSHLFPWNFLHICGEADDDPRWFLGARARIKRSLINHQNKLPASIGTKDPLILIGADTSLEEVKDKEVPHIRSLHPEHARTRMLPPFAGADRHGLVQQVRKLMIDAKASVIHFACHGEKTENSTAASMTIDDGLVIASDILFLPGDELTVGPVIFLNACQMAITTFDRDQAFANVFLGSGARAVLAPECHVSDARSAAFACLVYDKLAKERKSLVDSVRDATNEMIARHELTGLMYTIHGQADAQFV
jgi:hypothetical protein